MGIEREKNKIYSIQAKVKFLSSPPGNRTGQKYKWNIKQQQQQQKHQQNQSKVINKKCIYMQMFNYTQKEEK